MNLLLLSSSRVGSTDYLEHAKNLIKQHLGSTIKDVLFIPYAGVSISFDAYEEMVATAFANFGFNVRSIHQFEDPKKAVLEAQAIAVGGGNTFCLLNALYEFNLIESIQEKVKSGMPYIGWSAGSNITAPSIKTTNDMPIMEPPSFSALNLLPFQLNPHYIDGNPPGHNGETREMRISEFLQVNSEQTVIGIPEGSALKLENNNLRYLTNNIENKTAYKFTLADGKKEILPDENLSYLLG